MTTSEYILKNLENIESYEKQQKKYVSEIDTQALLVEPIFHTAFYGTKRFR